MASNVVSNAIIITGSARSGTTIMGKIVHSFQGVEYVNEPPMLFSLISKIDDVGPNIWKLLYETYLYEEFLINALAGRSINCNRGDDSSIYHVKGNEEIEARLQNSYGKLEVEDIIKLKNVQLAYKMPDIVPYVSKINDIYPSRTVVVMLRDATETINSLIAKKWFAKENETSAVIWPFSVHRGVNVPYWVKEGDELLWIELNEIDRSAYYYIRMNEDVSLIQNSLKVSYSDLVNSPLQEVKKISELLGCSFGEKTKMIIDDIRPREHKRDSDIVRKISDIFRFDVKRYNV